MKIYIMVDMEGISGISGSDFVKVTGRYYQLGRKYYTMDINACVRGCYKAGADKVIVKDGHGAGNHAIWEDMEPGVELIQGQYFYERFPGIEECDALILLGYHAMAGTAEALMEHTFDSSSIQNMWLNDALVGEFAIDSATAAEFNVPTIMVSGDDKTCLEAKQWVPNVITCQVKKGDGCQQTRLLPIEEAHKLIETKTEEAIRNMSTIHPPKIEYPVRLRKEVIERGKVRLDSNIKQINARTIEVESNSIQEAFTRIIL